MVESFIRRLNPFSPAGLLLFILLLSIRCAPAAPIRGKAIFSRSNLVAWCVVPFDSKNRGPEERAVMLNGLGITRLAYDWREKHIPEFDRELDALKKHDIRLQGFWYMSGSHPEEDKNLALILDLFRRHKTKTQLWCMFLPEKGFDDLSQDEKIRRTAVPVAYVAEELAKLGCSLGLYNHGGWFGEPENQLALIGYLRKTNIGMVYNFSHAEKQLARFPLVFPKILPYLYSLNITGMREGAKPGDSAIVVPVGQGTLEEKMIAIVRKSSYEGPVGIINENFSPDAAEGLALNIAGLKKILYRLGDRAALATYRE